MELMLHVIQIYGLNIIVDYSNTININFVLMIWAVVWVEQFENLESLGMQFQPYGPSKNVLIWPKRRSQL